MGRGLGAEVGGRYGELIRAAGVELRLGVRVASVSTGGRGTRLQLDDGGVLEADEIVVAVGAAPEPRVAGWTVAWSLPTACSRTRSARRRRACTSPATSRAGSTIAPGVA